MMRRLSGNKTLTPCCVMVAGADLVLRKNTARTVTSVFVVARFKIGHTRRKFPVARTATSRFIAYLVQSRLIIIPNQAEKCKSFFKKILFFCQSFFGSFGNVDENRDAHSFQSFIAAGILLCYNKRKTKSTEGEKGGNFMNLADCPSLHVIVLPEWENNTVSSARVSLCLKVPSLQPGELLCSFLDEIYAIPTAIQWDSLEIKDNVGNLEVRHFHQTGQHEIYHQLFVKRKTEGPILLTYRAAFAPARPNPVLDMGQEPGGVTGSGYCWMPSFPKNVYQLHMEFSRANLPQGVRALWAHGEDCTNLFIREDGLQKVFYCFGKVDCVEHGSFGYYWIAREGVDASPIAHWTAKVFLKMADFFQDSGESYKIFARARSCRMSGGTALNRSYTYIYDPQNPPPFTQLKFLFSHEMVHNWALLFNEPYGTCTWYIEGMAEYYSLVLPWRMGLVSREELLIQLNERAEQYYCNPCIEFTNLHLGNLLFHDLEATTVPYGRGLFYLMEMDHRIRTKTSEKYCLDDVMLKLLHDYRKNPHIQNRVWLEAVSKIAGYDETERFLAMCQGIVIPPELSCFTGANFAFQKRNAFTRREKKPCHIYYIH